MGRTSEITYCEGLPGLGKTTAAIGLAAGLSAVILIGENNPLPADRARIAGLDPQAAAGWYLLGERRRSAYATDLARQHGGHIVCDKGALATLAYTYAATSIGRHPPRLYRQVRSFYLREIRPHLTTTATTIVFAASVDVALARRATKPDRALRPIWYDPAFLHAQTRFYTEQAPYLAPGPLLTFDATIDRTDLLPALAADLNLPTPHPPEAGLDPVDYQDLPNPFRRTAERIGPEILGQALGRRPFGHLTGLAQAFERHLLLSHDGAPATVHLQAQHWRDTAPEMTPVPRTRRQRLPGIRSATQKWTPTS